MYRSSNELYAPIVTVNSIGVLNEIGGTADAPTLTTTVNGKSSTVNLPAGGGAKVTKLNTPKDFAILKTAKVGDKILIQSSGDSWKYINMDCVNPTTHEFIGNAWYSTTSIYGKIGQMMKFTNLDNIGDYVIAECTAYTNSNTDEVMKEVAISDFHCRHPVNAYFISY